MGPLKISALSIGSLALLQGAAGSSSTAVKPTGKVNTADVLEALNLFRNGRIDGGLNALGEKSLQYTVELLQDFLTVNSTAPPHTCAPSEDEAETHGLLIEVPAATTRSTNPFNIRTLLDEQLEDGLDGLIAQAGKTQPEYSKRSERNLAYLSSATATKVGCALTTGCEAQTQSQARGGPEGSAAAPSQYFFCTFDGVTPPPAVTKAFADALKARKAVVSISDLTIKDADTPLTPRSSAPTVALSALAVLGTAMSAILFL